MLQANSKRYVAWTLALVAIAGLAIPAFNLALDPQDLKGLSGLAKPDYSRFDPTAAALGWKPDPLGSRQGKSLDIGWYRPDAVAFGSSVVFGGIDPMDAAWQSLGRLRVYNYGLAGATISEIEAFVGHAEALHPLKVAVIALQFFMFNALHPAQPDFAAVPLATQPFYRERVLTLLARRLVSTDYLEESLGSLGFSPAQLLERARGGITALLPTAAANPAPTRVTTVGYHERLIASDNAAVTVLYNGSQDLALTAPDGHSGFDSLRRILTLARRHGTRVFLFIPPSHARTWEMIRALGYWPLFQEWQRRLVSVVAEDNAAHPDAAQVPIWDFGGYNSMTAEELPDPATGGPSRFHLDSIHFDVKVGDTVLDRMFGHQRPERPVPDDFGTLLAPEGVEARLAAIEEAHARYASEHADVVREIADIARAHRIGSGR